MNKSKTIIIIAVSALIIIGLAYLLIAIGTKKIVLTGQQTNQAAPGQPAQIKTGDKTPEAAKPVESATRSAVPENIKIPEVGEKTDNSVAAPSSVAEAAPGITAKLRSFNIKGENGVFNPSTVIVKKGDSVHINFLAADKDYDITFPDYGMKQTAKKGETKVLEFQAVLEGKFAYYCESCGGLKSKAVGYIIIAP